jgi:carbon storage regulator
MLILTRRPAETIYIGEQVTVTVLGVVGNQVRFGIEAPRSITIDRAEIYERKKRSAQDNGPGPNDAHSNGSDTGAPNGNVAAHQAGDEDDEVDGNVADAPVAQAATAAVSQAKVRR